MCVHIYIYVRFARGAMLEIKINNRCTRAREHAANIYYTPTRQFVCVCARACVIEVHASIARARAPGTARLNVPAKGY